ncbi:2-oxoacid:acceptor oxidoreductase subunit delta [Clostridia bacterium]|nr:2-oxoacid:acceptor oxidoreductase subunit delta [Clostridia bacterium]
MKNITFDEEKCKGCGLCVSACPKKIVVLLKDKINRKGYNPAGVTDKALCISCGQCAIMCPDTVITVENDK